MTFVYDEDHYNRVADSRSHDHLAEILGREELLNHISTVFYTDDFEIEVGKANPKLQYLMKYNGIQWVIGLTPKNPRHNPRATDEDNQMYVREFAQLLNEKGLTGLPAYGRARDFREGGDGCFILINVSPDETRRLLNGTQLSFICLPQQGQAWLVSCIEPT